VQGTNGRSHRLSFQAATARYSKLPQRFADPAVRLLLPGQLCGRCLPLGWAGPRHQRRPYGATAEDRGGQLWYFLQDYAEECFTPPGGFDYTDGRDPDAGLVQASSGKLYGTTYGGGAYNGGTIYRITPAGALRTV
jgi:uncharacterized repeat protein (TIGR03803 family)